MTTPLSSTAPGVRGQHTPDAGGTSQAASGTGNHADDMLYKVMADIEQRRDERDRKAVGAVASGSIHAVGKALRENQRDEAGDRVLLKAINKYANSVTKNAQKVKIA